MGAGLSVWMKTAPIRRTASHTTGSPWHFQRVRTLVASLHRPRLVMSYAWATMGAKHKTTRCAKMTDLPLRWRARLQHLALCMIGLRPTFRRARPHVVCLHPANLAPLHASAATAQPHRAGPCAMGLSLWQQTPALRPRTAPIRSLSIGLRRDFLRALRHVICRRQFITEK